MAWLAGLSGSGFGAISSCEEDAAYSGMLFYLRKAESLDRHEVMRLLDGDRARDYSFEASWREAERLYELYRSRFPRDAGDDDCGITKARWTAVVCYTLERPNVCREFNRACRSARDTETSWREFKFKSMWCLLIDAFKLLPPFENVPGTLYRGVKTARLYNECDTARFPHFVSASECSSVAERFGRGGCVLALQSVPPQFVRDISRYSVYPQHEEVLIWPLCSFTVKSANVGGMRYFKFEYAAPLRDPIPLPSRVSLLTVDIAAENGPRDGDCDNCLSLKFAQLHLLCVAPTQLTADVGSIVLDPCVLEHRKRQRRARLVLRNFFAPSGAFRNSV